MKAENAEDEMENGQVSFQIKISNIFNSLKIIKKKIAEYESDD